MATAAKTISDIDKQIDANRRQLLLRVKMGTIRSARDWQAAWDKHPDLFACERDLFLQRGNIQLERAIADAERASRAYRPARAKKCPTCGALAYRLAA